MAVACSMLAPSVRYAMRSGIAEACGQSAMRPPSVASSSGARISQSTIRDRRLTGGTVP